mmetsp:Transcript_44291/g.73469  ORF Transcript_44291/g.73469 Transcript_44291/m.73469 type:complete len:216 (-) Transcript_44291:442-1089(-)
MKSAASRWISRGKVALNMKVCRSRGMSSCSTMRRICGSKPMSSMRSASSRTRYVTRRRFVVPPSRWSISRPGVATTISTPARRSATCARFGTPPYTHVFLMPLLPPNLSHSSLICRASSRVGATTRTIGPSPGCRYGCALMWTIAGRRKANVLPDPVAEMPTMSLPSRAIGQPWLWMGVGAVKRYFITSRRMYSGIEASSKVRQGLGMPWPSMII